MIDGTLTLKRFADKAIKGLLAREDALRDEGDLEAPVQSLTIEEKDRQIELEDAVRSGLKQGLGSRQNAPAEWIGK
jgi:cullin-4